MDPALSDLLFERFVSAERNEPPDIDVDFEHERREEVIQYVYDKYGRDHAGMTDRHLLPREDGVARGGEGVRPVRRRHRGVAERVWRRHWDDVMAADVASVGLDPRSRCAWSSTSPAS